MFVDYIVKFLPEELQNLEINYSCWNSEDRKELLKATIINGVTTDYSGLIFSFDKVLVEKNLNRVKER